MMKLALLLILLLSSPALAQTFTVPIILDDVGSWAPAKNRLADPYPDNMPLVDIATPNIDAIALAGFTHSSFRVYSVCTQSRLSLFGFGPTERHKIGWVKGPANDTTDYQIEPRQHHHLIRDWKEANPNNRVAYFGKSHFSHWWINDRNKGGTFLRAMGVDYAEAVFIANVENPLPGYDYQPLIDDPTHPWSVCGSSNNYFVVTDLDGAVTVHKEYSSKLIFDEAISFMQAERAGPNTYNWLIFIAPVHPHNPIVAPADNLGCLAASKERSDQPPSPFNTAAEGDSDALYQVAIEYIDDRIGDVWDEMFVLSDTLIITSDNGVQTDVDLSAECNTSPGKKLTPFRCGTGAPFIARGPGIIANKVLAQGLFNTAVDFAPTLLGLAGYVEKAGHGTSFADCMKELRGYSATNCPRPKTREYVEWAEWKPVGGASGVLKTLPNPTTDPANTWTNLEYSIETAIGAPMLYHSVYDFTTESPMEVAGSIWPIDSTQQGRYIDAGEARLTSVAMVPLDDSDFLSGPSDEESANLTIFNAMEARFFGQGGRPPRTRAGFSR